MRAIAIDPSGNFTQGKGHTGIATIADDDFESLLVYEVRASDYPSRFKYWEAIKSKIRELVLWEKHMSDVIIVIESFVIRMNGFTVGIMPETIQLIGTITHWLDANGVKWVLQTPSQAKIRFKEELLSKYVPGFEKKGKLYYLRGKLINDHKRDAVKHLLYYSKYTKERMSK